MKRFRIRLACILLSLLLLLPTLSLAETTGFSDHQTLIFEAIKWSNDFPKNAQVTNAIEYLGKIDEYQVHLLLVQATQSDMAKAHYGTSAELILMDLDSDTVITCTNVVWPETSEITSKEDLLNMLFSCWDSYLLGYNPHVYFDAEIIMPLNADEIAAINAALSAYFTKPE